MNRTMFFKLMLHGSITCLLLTSHVIAQTNKRDPDEGPKRQTNRGLTIVIVIVISVLFLIGLIFLFIRNCASFLNCTGGMLRRSQSMPPRLGLDPALVKTFPTFLYSEVKEHKIGPATLECTVCLLEFEDHEILRLLPECSQVFHLKCIDAWLAIHDTCPVCRDNLVPKPGSDLAESNSLLRNGVSGSVQMTNDIIIDMNTTTTTTPEVINKPNDQNYPPRSTLRLPEESAAS